MATTDEDKIMKIILSGKKYKKLWEEMEINNKLKIIDSQIYLEGYNTAISDAINEIKRCFLTAPWDSETTREIFEMLEQLKKNNPKDYSSKSSKADLKEKKDDN